MQSNKTGLWGLDTYTPQQLINGGMKIISALNLTKKKIKYPEQIMDYIFSHKYTYYDACDHLNALFVLRYAYEATQKTYRKDDMEKFCRQFISRAEKHFFVREGGFSFLAGKYPRRYYGMKVTDKFSGADIHGTMLFTWGVSLVSKIIGYKEGYFQEIINNKSRK